MLSTASLADPLYIQQDDVLNQIVQILKNQDIIGVDTESNSLYAFQEQVCLIQFSTYEEDFLVDPLAVRDLSPLSEIFNNPTIQKVFHAAEYDLICLKRDHKFEFINIFDTSIAARILGRKEVGLGNLLQSEFGITIDKHFQRANWGQRPLPQDQLKYAQLDTHFLIDLKHKLEAELITKNLLPLAKEDFERACGVNRRDCNHHKIDDVWRVSGSRDLPPEKAAVLQVLCNYRDQVARQLDRPLFKVFSDKALIDITIACPQNLKELTEIRDLSQRQINHHGLALLKCVKNGLISKPLFPTRATRPHEDYLIRLEALRAWRKTTAEKMGVPSDVILPRDLLLNLAETNPQKRKALETVLFDVPWRYAKFGDQILELLSGLNSSMLH